MTKFEIFIDFEAISSPFNREFNAKEDWPFAYTLGCYIGKTFKTKTHVINFGLIKPRSAKEITVHEINFHLSQRIEKDVKALTKINEFNKDSIEFVAWSGELERNILNRYYPSILVKDLNTDAHLPLKRITSDEISSASYFKTFREDAIKNVRPGFYEARGLKDDGAMAALAGYILFLNQTKKEGKYNFKTDINKLMAELTEYSKDDVLRMKIVNDKGQAWMNSQSKIHKQRIETINKSSRIVSRNARMINDLKSFDQKISVSELVKILEKEAKEASAELEKIRAKK